MADFSLLFPSSVYAERSEASSVAQRDTIGSSLLHRRSLAALGINYGMEAAVRLNG
jgi:hypothetical protein